MLFFDDAQKESATEKYDVNFYVKLTVRKRNTIGCNIDNVPLILYILKTIIVILFGIVYAIFKTDVLGKVTPWYL